MPVEKLGWFRKKVAGLGKRIYFWKLRKINLYSVNSMVRQLVRLYGDINNGNFAQGIRDFAAQIEDGSKDLISEMVDEPILLGMSMNSVLSKSVDDIAFTSALIFWSILGKDYKEMWSDPELVLEDDGSAVMKLRQKRCLFCAEESNITREMLGETMPGEILASMFKGILQVLQDYVGNEYDVTAKETKCFMRGDPYGEVTVWLKPKT